MELFQDIPALLLQTIDLPGDDVILSLYTRDLGRISVFASKLQRSKKRLREIDFFRVLSVNLSKRGSSYVLKDVKTLRCFSVFSSDLELMEKGFNWIDIIRRVPEESADISLFDNIIGSFIAVDARSVEVIELFLRFKIFQSPNTVPRFDQIKETVYFCPQNFQFSVSSFPGAYLLKNNERQFFEFLRRYEIRDVIDSLDRLPRTSCKRLMEVVEAMERWH